MTPQGPLFDLESPPPSFPGAVLSHPLPRSLPDGSAPGSGWGWAENVPEVETPNPRLSAKVSGGPSGFPTRHQEQLLHRRDPRRRKEQGLVGEGK